MFARNLGIVLFKIGCACVEQLEFILKSTLNYSKNVWEDFFHNNLVSYLQVLLFWRLIDNLRETRIMGEEIKNNI